METLVLTRWRLELKVPAVAVMKHYGAVLGVVLRWTTVEISGRWERKPSHPLVNEDSERLAGLDPAISAKAPNARWAEPGREELL